MSDPMKIRATMAGDKVDVKVLMSLNGAAVLFFGIMPQPLMALCLYSIQASL